MRELIIKVTFGLTIILFSNIQSANAQWTFPYPTTGAPCSSCVPPGWTMISGSPDLSSLANWIGYSHYMSTGVINPVPEPSPGVTSFMSAMAYSAGTEETTTSFTLASPQVLTVHFGGFGTSISGSGPVGAQPGVTENLIVNGASVSVPIPWDGQWHAVTYNLPAGPNTITLDPSIGDNDDRHVVHISIAANQPGTGCTENLNDLSSATTVCLGQPVTLEASSNLGGNITWTGGVTNGVPFTPATAGVFSYTATSDDVNDCPLTNSITVNALPVVTANDNGPYCTGDPMSVSETGGQSTTWSWSSNGSATITPLTGQNPTVTGAVDGEIFTVTATDANGCVNTSQATYIVNPLPTVTASNTGPFCEGVPMSVDETGGNSTTWSWSTNGGATITPISGQNPAITGAVDGEIFTVTGTDASGCVNTSQTTLSVVPLPTATNLIGGGTYCQGDQISNIMVDVTGSASWTVDYTLDGNPLTVTQGTSPVDLGNAAGVYVITGVTDASCTNTASGTQSIIINPSPSAPTAGADATYCDGDVVVDLTAAGTGGTLNWYADAGLTNNIGTGGVITPSNQIGTMNYYVTETSNGCTGPPSVVMVIINDCSVPVVITVPSAITPDGDGLNDVWEIVNIDTTYPDNSVFVFNRWGNVLFEHNSASDGPYDQKPWDGTFKGEILPVGSYYYLIEYNDTEGGSTSGAVSIIK